MVMRSGVTPANPSVSPHTVSDFFITSNQVFQEADIDPITSSLACTQVFTFQFIWLSLCECSTPFVNLRWVLHTLGYKDSKLYLVNGFFLTMTFFFFR